MADRIQSTNAVFAHRISREWSQAELASRAGISRAAVSAIEGRRLTPSVAAALALAAALECSVEELFSRPTPATARGPEWAWAPRSQPCRFWEAEVSRRQLLYPVEATSLNPAPHDGISDRGFHQRRGTMSAESTLTLACCDPAASLLAAEYARASAFRLLVFPRGGRAALELVHQGLVHLAGLHLSTVECPERNAETVRSNLGDHYHLLRATRWEEGIALPGDDPTRSPESLARSSRRWAARESGSAARECLDELLGHQPFSGREVHGHAAVAEAVYSGWADAGICVRLCAEEAGLNFLPVRTEVLDFCFSASIRNDPRIQALIRLLRSDGYRRLQSELPGYDGRGTGELTNI